MNSFTSYRPSNNRNPECEDLLRAAEQELSAFFKAVTEVFGSEQAVAIVGSAPDAGAKAAGLFTQIWQHAAAGTGALS